MHLLKFILPVLCLGILQAVSAALKWENLPDLPAGAGTEKQIGVAGAFTGSHNGAVIVAGGANFPHGLPWEETTEGNSPPKIYHNDIFVLKKEGVVWSWTLSSEKVPGAWAYGASVSHPKSGLICIGGETKSLPVDGKQKMLRSREVFALKWQNEKIEVDKGYPPLPRAVTGIVGARIGDVIYVIGGQDDEGSTRIFWALDLKLRGTDKYLWAEMPSFPGHARTLALAAAQHDGTSEKLYLFSGRNPGREDVELLTDAWRYDPKSGQWTQLPDIGLPGKLSRCVMAGTAVSVGIHGILVIGGAEGDLFRKLDYEIPAAIAAAKLSGDSAVVMRLQNQKLDILNKHSGFSRDVLAFNTVTRAWSHAGTIIGDSPVTLGAAKLGDRIILPSGERSPGIRTPQVLSLKLVKGYSFGGLNYAVLVIYMVAVLWHGLRFSRKVKGTDDFFKAGSRVPWWAAGLSIFGTQLSAITFIAIPAKVYGTDWRLLVGQFGIIIVAPFVIFLFLPFYRRLNVTTAYEYLEKRFNVFVRCFGSTLFILLQFGRIGIVLYLPAVALSLVTGMDVHLCILLMGLLCLVYTMLGGMEAVIWTDVAQVIILGGGAVFCLLWMAAGFPGGWNAMVDLADGDGKFRLLDFRWDLTAPAFGVVLLGSLCQNFLSYGTDQAVVQRYLTTPDERASARSIWMNGVLSILASFVFFGIGTALYSHFKMNPGALAPGIANSAAMFPYYIVTSLPAGLAGLLIAGVFAASMSSIDSAMNSVSAAVTTDFYRRFRGDVTEASALKVARGTVVVVGLLGTSLALYFAHLGSKSIWDSFAGILGFFGGGLAGVFLLGILTRRTHGVAAAFGLLASAVVQWFLVSNDVNPWFLAFTGVGSCVIAGLIAGMVLPGPRKDLEGLTIHTIKSLKPSGDVHSSG
ncbi:MAG: sodium/solute symporter [Opitutae bacterium]|nr:sodium/solute symporter [Opitutae bacterium]